MNNDVQYDAPCGLFQFEGELRADHVEALYDLIGPVLDQRVVVDCQRVSRFGEGALEALVAFEQTLTDRGSKVILVGVRHPELRNVVLLEPVCRAGASWGEIA